MYKLRYTTKFQKNVKLMKKRGKNLNKLNCVLELLVQGEVLPQKYCDHLLTGNYEGYRECHIEPDWLLVYKVINDELIIVLLTTGTHSDLF